MNYLAIIPARSGSKGIVNKNKTLLNKKTLIEYTLIAAKKSLIKKICVTTDDNDIKEISSSYGIEVIDRPKELATDESTSLSAIQHVLQHYKYKPDAVVLLQPTSPLRNSKHINEAIETFERNPKCDSLVSVTKVPHNMIPECLMKLQNKRLINISTNDTKRRQEKDVYFARNGAAIYISKTNVLRNSILGEDTVPYIMNKLDSIDIDDYEDLEIAQLILEKYNF